MIFYFFVVFLSFFLSTSLLFVITHFSFYVFSVEEFAEFFSKISSKFFSGVFSSSFSVLKSPLLVICLMFFSLFLSFFFSIFFFDLYLEVFSSILVVGVCFFFFGWGEVVKVMFYDYFYSFKFTMADYGFSLCSFLVFDVLMFLISMCMGIFLSVLVFILLSFSNFWVSEFSPSGTLDLSMKNLSVSVSVFDYLMVAFPVLFCFLSTSSCSGSAYSTEGFLEVDLVMHIVAFQWGWRFFYPNGVKYSAFYSTEGYSIKDSCLSPLVLPVSTKILLTLSSLDVMHSVGSENLGFKVDAIPGHSNSLFLFSDCVGLSFAYCSEFCGVNHSFMGFSLDFVDFSDFFYFSNL